MKSSLYKTSLCRYYENEKICPLGDQCHFAHGDVDLRSESDPLPERIKKTKNKKEKKTDALQKTNFKTIVCKYWEKGECKYETNCTFAHGDVEMRTIMENAEKLNGGKNLMAMMGFEPDKTIDIMMLINARQLQVMSDKLLIVYPKATPTGKKLARAVELLQQLKIQEAAMIVEDVVMNPNLPPDMKPTMESLLAEAKVIGEEILNSLRNGIIPEYILQVPSLTK